MDLVAIGERGAAAAFEAGVAGPYSIFVSGFDEGQDSYQAVFQPAIATTLTTCPSGGV